MTANGPLMYHVSPLYNFSSDIILPTCMYRMNNIHDTNFSLGSTDEMNLSNTVDLVELEKSQLNIIQKLEDLKEKVLKLKVEFGVVENNNLGTFQDVVIKANPQYPPLSLWVLCHLFSQTTAIRLNTYLHSSLNSIPENINKLENISSSNSCKTSLTVIWRDGNKDHEMMVDPIHQGIVEGEVNIARYLSRLFSLNYETDPILSTMIDNYLELVHSSIIHGNNKERQGALRSLNSQLGKNAFIVGDSYTIADIVTWSALIQAKLHQSLPANVMKWFNSLSNVDIFQKCDKLISL
ncbi:aminoacyl tRNA synthase complex-interacting multifunctional protein 2 [Trichonephila clavata]|uniref:Aminoacyl tRNA synthase complex-interacting multifunctional protein 2 n=1 Tax=Trichonephila clavata TaxID=2740835 RepID=A0A8X6JBZ8_TRICU|nr:aminoacyl tRNA synthase complex-interacting multifunctional protein 2 [Trichonephila clavata]